MSRAKHAAAWLLCAIALWMVGCNSETTQLKAQAYAATTLASSYRTLGTIEKVRIGIIKALPKAEAEVALKAHVQRYDIAKASLDALADAVDKSVAEGMTPALVAPLLAGATKVIAAIEALKRGGP